MTITATIPKKSIVCKMSGCGVVLTYEPEDITILKETYEVHHNIYETETFEVIKCPKCGFNNKLRKVSVSDCFYSNGRD